MVGKSLLALAVAFLAAIALITQFVLADEFGAPAGFSGTVQINGAPAADGTTVVAKINNVVYGRATVSGGRYLIYVKDTSTNNAGKTIQFFVSDVAAQTAIFAVDDVHELDLSVTISSPPPSSPPSSSPPSSGGGSGGGGGGGGGSSSRVSAVENESVTEEQEQLIAAAVENSLPPLPASPPREEPVIPAVAGAIAETQSKPSGGGFGALTGFLVAVPGKLGKGGAVVVVLALAAIAFLVYRKKQSKSPKGEVPVSK